MRTMCQRSGAVCEARAWRGREAVFRLDDESISISAAGDMPNRNIRGWFLAQEVPGREPKVAGDFQMMMRPGLDGWEVIMEDQMTVIRVGKTVVKSPSQGK